MDTNKKADMMRKCTEIFRKEFGISKPESVIQAYDCVVNGLLNRGTLVVFSHDILPFIIIINHSQYVSQNFICFKPSMGSVTARLPFSKISSINYKSGILSGSVTVVTSEKASYEFSSFSASQKVQISLFLFSLVNIGRKIKSSMNLSLISKVMLLLTLIHKSLIIMSRNKIIKFLFKINNNRYLSSLMQ